MAMSAVSFNAFTSMSTLRYGYLNATVRSHAPYAHDRLFHSYLHVEGSSCHMTYLVDSCRLVTQAGQVT